jgi:hypothetical protein
MERPCVFIEIFDMLPKNPNRNNEMERPIEEPTAATEYSEHEYKSNERKLIFLLPNLSTIQPEMGRALRAPKGSINKTAPSWASLKPNLSFTDGILDAQDEKISPIKKK